jgi:hypothetical protein
MESFSRSPQSVIVIKVRSQWLAEVSRAAAVPPACRFVHGAVVRAGRPLLDLVDRRRGSIPSSQAGNAKNDTDGVARRSLQRQSQVNITAASWKSFLGIVVGGAHPAWMPGSWTWSPKLCSTSHPMRPGSRGYRWGCLLGGMFAFRRKRLSGSYLSLSAVSRANRSP